MLWITRRRVNFTGGRKLLSGRAASPVLTETASPVCPPGCLRVRLATHSSDRAHVKPLLLIALIIGALVLVAAAWHCLRGRRHREMHRLLDAADALEARLRAAREQIEAVAGETHTDPVHAAMREMLRQRLWLREQGAQAPVAELHSVRISIDEARERIERQLERVQEARMQEG